MTAGIIDLVKFTYGSTVIYIDADNVKENFTNSLTPITPPTTESTPTTTKLINLNKVEKRYTIKGFLTNGQYDSETYSTAYAKKEGLKTIFGKGEVVTFTWESNDYTVGVDKYEIAYDAKDDKNTTKTSEIIYSVQISCVEGDDIV